MRPPAQTGGHDFWLDHVKFSVSHYNDGSTIVRSIHPYDFTEYHWALLSGEPDGYWFTALNTTFTGYLGDYYNGDDLSYEDVAKALLDLDRRAGLKPRMDRT